MENKRYNNIKNTRLKFTKDDNFYIKTKYKGYIGLMCPNCYSYYIREMRNEMKTMLELKEVPENYDIYESDITAFHNVNFVLKQCKTCKKEDVSLIEIDPNIVGIISKLNKKGFITKFCCEGHLYENCIEEKFDEPYIYFENNEILTYLNTLPLSWEIDLIFFKNTGEIIIRSDRNNYEYNLKELEEWVESLPCINKNF